MQPSANDQVGTENGQCGGAEAGIMLVTLKKGETALWEQCCGQGDGRRAQGRAQRSRETVKGLCGS